MVNFGKFSFENTVIFDDFLLKMTKVRPKYVSWGSNQEWGSIEADTVYEALYELNHTYRILAIISCPFIFFYKTLMAQW